MKVKDVIIGNRVRMVNCLEAEKYGNKIWTIVSEPWECCGSIVVRLKDKSGGFDISRLAIVEGDD